MLDFYGDLKRTNEILNRIATALECMAGLSVVEKVAAKPVEFRKTEAQDVRRVDISGAAKTLERLRKYGME